MNPNLNWAIVYERMQALQTEVDMAARQARFRRALAVARVGRRRPGRTGRGITRKAGEAL